jgi:hypothetical protein
MSRPCSTTSLTSFSQSLALLISTVSFKIEN